MELNVFENEIFSENILCKLYKHNNVMKIFKIFLKRLKTLFQNIPKTFQNKHPINSHPRGWVWLLLSHLHHVLKI